MENYNYSFSIIIPTYNSIQYINECISSAINQNYLNYNIIILDSGSKDNTIPFIENIQSKKIIIYKTNKRLTIEENWDRIKSIPKNEFMTILGHDDVLSTDYLEEMNLLINSNPKASLYQSHFNFIDSKSAFLNNCLPMNNIIEPQQLLESILTKSIDIMASGFMIRSRDYESINGIKLYPNLLYADYSLLIDSVNLGFLAVSKKICFSFRIHQSTTTTSQDEKMHSAFQMFIEYLKNIKEANHLFKKSIDKYGADFLLQNIKSLAHRMLRTPFKNRKRKTIAHFIDGADRYYESLGIKSKNDLRKSKQIKLALLIDSNPLFRYLFLLFKKINPNPILH